MEWFSYSCHINLHNYSVPYGIWHPYHGSYSIALLDILVIQSLLANCGYRVLPHANESMYDIQNIQD